MTNAFEACRVAKAQAEREVGISENLYKICTKKEKGLWAPGFNQANLICELHQGCRLETGTIQCLLQMQYLNPGRYLSSRHQVSDELPKHFYPKPASVAPLNLPAAFDSRQQTPPQERKGSRLLAVALGTENWMSLAHYGLGWRRQWPLTAV